MVSHTLRQGFTRIPTKYKTVDAADLAVRAMDVIKAVKTWMYEIESASTEFRQNPVHLAGHQSLPWKT